MPRTMAMNSFSVAISGIVFLLCGCFCELVLCYREEGNLIRMTVKPGGIRDCLHGLQNSAEIEGLARFAVQEHNKKQNAFLEFVRVLKAKEQVVAGKLYHLTLEAMDAGKKVIYEAKVLVKPWMHLKQLQEFNHAEGGSSFTTSDLGIKGDGQGPGWRPVPTNDPLVQDAANHAIKSIQQRSNSLSPYELLEILLAKAKVIEDYAKFDLLLRVRRGIKEDNFRVKVTRNREGKFFYS
uniref:Cysteine proteinase inhibitor n=1 Tax=Rhizophora mucronata TaxID=61149 RepID=A0A2P2ILF9_RHIMU